MNTVADHVQSLDLELPGLAFVPNRTIDVGSDHVPQTKVVSNGGAIVGHFACWPDGHTDDAFVVNAARIDALTFVAAEPRTLIGRFVDCRPGAHGAVTVRFATSPGRKLRIPAGVGYAIAGLGGVVVRNDVELLVGGDDGLRFSVDRVPVVHPARYPMPSAAALASYAPVGAPAPSDDPVRIVPNAVFPLPDGGVGVGPSTASCVMDLVLAAGDADRDLIVHTRHDVLHTFLDHPGAPIEVELVDLRALSPRFGEGVRFPFAADPRHHLRIPAGVAYRYRSRGAGVLRVEYDLFVDPDEPRADLCPIGGDLRVVLPGDRTSREGVRPPEILAPPEILRMLMRKELQHLGTWSR